MEIDLFLAEESLKRKKFFLRWYGWSGLSLSFGYSQRRLLNRYPQWVEKVVRPTGGGVLIHGWDISYAFTTPAGVFKSPLHLYRFVSEIFVETFRGLGLEVSFSRNKKGDYRQRELCQLVPTFGEVVYNGKKLVASAVRRFEEGNYLIHGSVYISYNYPLAEKLLNTPSEVLKNTISTLSEVGIKRQLLMEKFTNFLTKALLDLKEIGRGN